MRQRLMTADGFYDNPQYFRKLSQTAEYKNNVSVEEYVTEEAVAKFSFLAQQNLKVLPNSGKFHLSTETTDLKPVSADLYADWIGIVYLNLPSQAQGERAVSFYTHVKTGLENIPNSTEAQLGGWNTIDEVLEGFVDIDGLSEKSWTSWFTVYQKYNRVALWDAKLWHQELKGFGDAINNCRLSQLFYLGNS